MGRVKVAGRPAGSPLGAFVLSRYAELEDKARRFSAGAYNLLVIAGPPGVAKSTVLKQALRQAHGPNFCLVEANASPYGAYCRCWERRNQLTLFDDSDGIWQQESGPRFLKQLCQTEQWKEVSWESKSTMGRGAVAPPRYHTSSKVCIITNNWCGEANPHIEAVADRGQCWLFQPTALETHRFTAGWFWDQEVFDYVGSHLPHLKRFSCRLYHKCWEQKQAGDDWRRYLRAHCYHEEDREYHVVRLMLDPALPTTDAKARRFVAEGHGSRATFYRWAKDFKERLELDTLPNWKVQGKPPEDQPDPMGVLITEGPNANEETLAEG